MTVSEPQQARLNIPEALNRAIEYTRRMMFTPFDFGMWLNIGVIAFIASLGRSGGGFSGGFNYRSGFGGQSGTFDARTFQAKILEGKAWVLQNEALVISIVLVVLALCFAFGLLFLWLSCRGQMMLIRAVARRDVRIGENWSAVARPAWSLFLFRLVLSLISLVVVGALLVISASIVWTQVQQGSNHIMQYVSVMIPALALFGVVTLGFMVVDGLLNSFVTPLMYHFDISCLDAWRHLGAISRGNVWRIVLFLVIRVAYTMGLGMARLLVGCLTCCIGLLPIVNQVIFAFFYVFDQAFCLCALETLGPDYRILLPDAGDAAAAPPPVPDGPLPGIS